MMMEHQKKPQEERPLYIEEVILFVHEAVFTLSVLCLGVGLGWYLAVR